MGRPRAKSRYVGAMEKKFPPPQWATGRTYRETGVIEDVCKHGIGHPNPAWYRDSGFGPSWAVHGCDGCCATSEND